MPYHMLLAYHAPAGNSIKSWTSMSMNDHVLAIRNDIHLLSLSVTALHLRKALNAVFSKVKKRATFLIYATLQNALKLNHYAVFTFVDLWVSGLISNYFTVINEIVINKTHKADLLEITSRPQKAAADGTMHKPILKATALYKNKKATKIGSVPAISLSMRDNYIWAHECNCLGIPSIQVCDTTSTFDKIDYPIVANQRSVSLAYLLVYLFAETCSTALIHEHLFFRSFTRYLELSRRNVVRQIHSQMDNWHRHDGNVGPFWRHFMKSKLYEHTYVYPHHTSLSPHIASHILRNYHPLNNISKNSRRYHTFVEDKRDSSIKPLNTFILQRKSGPKKILISNMLSYLFFKTFVFCQKFLARLGHYVDALYKWGEGRFVFQHLKGHIKSIREEIKQEIIDKLGIFKALSTKKKTKTKFLAHVKLKRRDLRYHDSSYMVYNLPQYYSSLKKVVAHIRALENAQKKPYALSLEQKKGISDILAMKDYFDNVVYAKK